MLTAFQRNSDGTEITNSRVGEQSIKQCISALEHHRFNHQHQEIYQNCPASHLPLRGDNRITTFEKNARASEPERLAESQELRVAGGPTAGK